MSYESDGGPPMFPTLQKPYIGPFLKLQSYSLNATAASWAGSVLFACQSHLVQAGPLTLGITDQGAFYNLQGYVVDTFFHWTIWRFDILLQLWPNPRNVSYQVQFPVQILGCDPVRQVTFAVPGAAQRWRWAAYSCSGYSSSVDRSKWGGDRHPMFQDLMEQHTQTPFHALVGGGDQLYNDKVFEASGELRNWLSIKNRKERLAAPFSAQMKLEAETFYFSNYCTCFTEPDMFDAFASIPNVMIWDDHDIFDGWGSYPDDLLYCPVFQGIYHVACRFYLLFQQHCTYRMVMEGRTEFFGRVDQANHTSFNFIKQFGPDLCIVGADIRAERTKTQVISFETWELIFNRIQALPESVKHVVMLLTVPILYPKVPLTEGSLQLLSSLNRIDAINTVMQKTGLLSSIMEFDEPELLDDLMDHWTSGQHSEERKMVVNRLQEIAKQRGFRITFLSGDVHCAALGQFYSYPKMNNLACDERYIPQIITSAIINAPPPNIIIKMLHVFNKAKRSVNPSTREKMVRTFKGRYNNTDKVMGRRNYLIVQPDQLSPGMACTLRIELPESLGSCETFNIYVPELTCQKEVSGPCILASAEFSALGTSPTVSVDTLASGGSYALPIYYQSSPTNLQPLTNPLEWPGNVHCIQQQPQQQQYEQQNPQQQHQQHEFGPQV